MAIFFLLGNTTIKYSSVDGEVKTLGIEAARETLPGVLAGRRGEQVVAACVNPPCEPLLAEACRAAGLSDPAYAGRAFPAGVKLAVDNPSAVGIDRALNVKAAYSRAGRPCAAVDLGTAVSISVADAAGRFVGGAILPGMALSLKALASGTAFLPEVAPQKPASALGANTVEAMRSGVYYGTLGAIREIIDRTSGVLGAELAVFFTGGDAALIQGDAPRDWTLAPTLTMEGLRLAYEESLR